MKILSEAGLLVVYALAGGGVAFALASTLDKILVLSPQVRKWLYLFVLALPLLIYMLHGTILCSAVANRLFLTICRVPSPYAYWLGWGLLVSLLPAIGLIKFAPKRSKKWHDKDAEQNVSRMLFDICQREVAVFLIDNEYPQAYVEGWYTPVVCISKGLYQALDSKELEAVLKHEAAHVKSSDNALNILAVVMRSITAVSPFAHIAFARYVDAREQAADDAVDNSLDLASALVKVSKRGLQLQGFFASGLGSRSVTKRIEGLIHRTKGKATPSLVQGLLVASLLVALLIC